MNNKPDTPCCHGKKDKLDYILWGSLLLLALSPVVYFFDLPWTPVKMFFWGLTDIIKTIWWGMAIGLTTVGLMDYIPKEYFTKIMGRSNSIGGLFKACFAGLILDVCSHGILVVAGKLYERGLSVAQVMTFLIASPWNSFTVTLVLIALIGIKWTAIYIAGSLLIAFISGLIFWRLEDRGILPQNHNTAEDAPDLDIIKDAAARLKAFRPNKAFFVNTAKAAWKDGKMIVRWILFGAVLAAAMRAFIPQELFQDYLGPSLIGLAVTLLLATIIEVCSEGSAPIAAEIVKGGGAYGNGFTFLMAGVATDYTEMLAIKEFTGSWKTALFVPLVTVPQVLLLAWLMN